MNRRRRDLLSRLTGTRDALAGELKNIDAKIARAGRDVMRTALELARADGAEVEVRLGPWPDAEAAG